MRAALGLATFTAIALSTPVSAFAQSQHATRASRAFDELDFGTSIAEFEAVIHDPRATRTELTAAWQHLAMLRFARGDQPGAARAADAAAALDSQIGAPSGSPPPVNTLFRRAHQAHPTPIALRIVASAGSRDGAADVQADGRVEIFPLTLAVRCRDGNEVMLDRVTPAGSSAMRVVPSGHRPWQCEARLQTADGAVVANATSVLTPPMEQRAVVTPPPRTGVSPWAIGGGIAGGVVVIGAVITGIVFATAPSRDLVPLGPVTFPTTSDR